MERSPGPPPIVIAVDGPAASGKGTVSRHLRDFYGYAYLDTGVLYRGVGWVLLSKGCDPRDGAAATQAAQDFCLEQIVDADIRTSDVGRAASLVAVQPAVRAALLDFQRQFAWAPPPPAEGAILDGRDIGTVVCPDALVKLFVTASVEERARRRFEEQRLKDQSLSLQTTLEDIKRRDARDAGREHAPMRAADDAEVIDTTSLPIPEVVRRAMRLIDRALEKRVTAQGA